MAKTTILEEEKKYYLGKILCTADPKNPLRFIKHKFNHVFILYGFTGCGKDTIINAFLKGNQTYPFVKFIRTMTRPRRPSELDMVDGFFIKKSLFDYLKKHHRFFYSYKRYSGKEFGYDTIHFLLEFLSKKRY